MRGRDAPDGHGIPLKRCIMFPDGHRADAGRLQPLVRPRHPKPDSWAPPEWHHIYGLRDKGEHQHAKVALGVDSSYLNTIRIFPGSVAGS